MATPRLIDLTRSLRRAGRGPTGVDRVERAYMARFLADDVPVFGLMRTPLGYLLLDRIGIAQFQRRLERQEDWGRISLLSRLSRGADKIAKSAQSDVRRFAVGRSRRAALGAMLARAMPDGFTYYNLGHSNLTDRVLRAVASEGGVTIVMIHDAIPLEHPQFQRPGTVEPFRAKLKRVRQYADQIIYNSEDTRVRVENILSEWGPLPEAIVSHLGTIPPTPVVAEVPQNILPDRPYFVVLGTIEPRKNHAFLLDIWEQMDLDAPPLLICGRRGWNNDAVFARLDALPTDSVISEHADLSDGAIAELVKNSAGMLFPSHAEGYGLPPVEALSLGARVLCNDLGVLREIVQEKPVYASVSNANLWIETIKTWAKNPQSAQEKVEFSGPNWDDHFKTVLRLR